MAPSPALDPYVVSVDTDHNICCPVKGCPTYSTNLAVLRRHFCIRHPMDQFTIIGCSTFVQCPRCGILTTALNPRHFASQFCTRQSIRRSRTLASVQRFSVPVTPFFIDDAPIEFVDCFRYLGRILSHDDSDDMAAFTRLQQAQAVWARFSTLLQADGASVVTMGRFYRTVIQQTLLFGSATWVLSQRSLLRLERFQARCARGMAHRPIQRRPNGTWITPPTTEVLATCHLQPISTCIQHRRHTLFVHYADQCSSTYQTCLAMDGSTSRSMVWWHLNHDDPAQ